MLMVMNAVICWNVDALSLFIWCYLFFVVVVVVVVVVLLLEKKDPVSLSLRFARCYVSYRIPMDDDDRATIFFSF